LQPFNAQRDHGYQIKIVVVPDSSRSCTSLRNPTTSDLATEFERINLMSANWKMVPAAFGVVCKSEADW